MKKEKGAQLENIKFKRVDSQLDVVLDSREKNQFLKELSISEGFIKKLDDFTKRALDEGIKPAENPGLNIIKEIAVKKPIKRAAKMIRSVKNMASPFLSFLFFAYPVFTGHKAGNRGRDSRPWPLA